MLLQIYNVVIEFQNLYKIELLFRIYPNKWKFTKGKGFSKV